MDQLLTLGKWQGSVQSSETPQRAGVNVFDLYSRSRMFHWLRASLGREGWGAASTLFNKEEQERYCHCRQLLLCLAALTGPFPAAQLGAAAQPGLPDLGTVL